MVERSENSVRVRWCIGRCKEGGSDRCWMDCGEEADSDRWCIGGWQ